MERSFILGHVKTKAIVCSSMSFQSMSLDILQGSSNITQCLRVERVWEIFMRTATKFTGCGGHMSFVR